MKRLNLILTMLATSILLSACADDSLSDNFSGYRDMNSQAIIQQAEKNLAKHNFSDAVKDLSALDALFPFGPNAQQGLLDSIYAYYKDDQPEMALAQAQRFLRLYPQGQYADYALYMQGLIQYDSGLTWMQKKFDMNPATLNDNDRKEAFGAFSQLIMQFPRSRYAPDAAARLHYLRGLFADHEMIIANYYYKRHAYVAAINRANGIIAHYNGTASVQGALQLLVKCYQTLGLSTQLKRTQQLLQANFPSTKA